MSESYSVVRVEVFPEVVPCLGDRMEEKVGKDSAEGLALGFQEGPRRSCTATRAKGSQKNQRWGICAGQAQQVTDLSRTP